MVSLGRKVDIRNVGVRIKQRENTNCDLRKYATSQLVSAYDDAEVEMYVTTVYWSCLLLVQ